jgi:hypothetical protein
VIPEPEIRRARDELRALQSVQNVLELQLSAAAIISRLLAYAADPPTIVGGSAVSFYTGGAYLSRDVDLVTALPGPKISGILDRIGFRRQNGAWIHAEADVVVDFPSPPLAGDVSRVATVETPFGPIRVIGAEDLLVDRLNAVVHWRDSESREWCVTILALHQDLDMPYLLDRARAEGVDGELAAVLEEARSSDQDDSQSETAPHDR